MGDMADDARDRADDAMIRQLVRRPYLNWSPSTPIVDLGRPSAGLLRRARVDRFGSEPPVGSVLRWQARGTGQTLTYLGVRTPNGWWTTRDNRNGGCSWSEIVDLIGDNNPCDVAVGWREVPAPAPEPSGDDAVLEWAKRFEPMDVEADDSTDEDEAPEPEFDSRGENRGGWTRADLARGEF